MQFSKYILTLALLAVLAEATEQSSISMNKENVKQTVSKASTVAHSHETPKATLEYHDYGHGYGDKDYDSGKSTQIYEDEDYDKTVTYKYDHTTKATHETTKTQKNTKETHKASLHWMHTNGGHHNTSTIHKGSVKQMVTSILTSTKLYMDESTITIIQSEATSMADYTTTMEDATMTQPMMIEQSTMTEPIMMDTTSSQLTFNVFTMSSCTGCITAPVETGVITAAVSAQDFTSAMPTTAISDMMIATPTYYMQSTLITAMTSAATSVPSAGFASTSRAVFTGSAARQSADYLLVAVLPAIVGMLIWI